MSTKRSHPTQVVYRRHLGALLSFWTSCAPPPLVPSTRRCSRKQFGRLIGSYQALKHPTVEAHLGMEQARSHLYAAAHTFERDRAGEIAVRMAWTGMPVVNLPVGVRYLDAAEGGVSHFRPLGDNLRFGWLHSRLCTRASWNWFWRKALFWRKT